MPMDRELLFRRARRPPPHNRENTHDSCGEANFARDPAMNMSAPALRNLIRQPQEAINATLSANPKQSVRAWRFARPPHPQEKRVQKS